MTSFIHPRFRPSLMAASALIPAALIAAVPARAQAPGPAPNQSSVGAVPGAPDGTVALPEVNVAGRGESALDPVRGFVANQEITGTKTDTPLIENPQSISVVTRDQIDARQAQTLGEALRYNAGIRTENFGPDTRTDWFQLRGFNAQDNGIFLNGLRYNAGYAGSVFETYGLERYEILRGPTSVLYGQIAPGGLVNQVQRRPTETAQGEIRLSAGSYGRLQAQGFASGPLTADGTWSGSITALGRNADTQVDSTRDNRIFIAPALTWRPDADTRVTVLPYYQLDRTNGGQFLPYTGTVTELPGTGERIGRSRFTGEQDFDRFTRQQYGIGYEFERRLDEVFTARQNFRYSHTGIQWEQIYGVGLAADGRTLNRFSYNPTVDVNTVQVDNQLQARFNTGPIEHTVLGGFDYSQVYYRNLQSFASVGGLDLARPVYGRALIPNINPPSLNDRQVTTQYGLYAQDQIRFDRFVVTLGIRQDWALADVDNRNSTGAGRTREQNDDATTWRAGIIYLSPVGLAPYFSYARSFQPQIGTNASGGGFDPLRGEQYEVGVKYQPPGINSFVQASAFHLTQRNTLTADPNLAFSSLSLGEVRVRGVEVEAVASLAQGLNLIASFTHLDAEITETNTAGERGRRPAGVAKNQAGLYADYAFAEGSGLLSGFGFGFGARFIGNNPASNFGGPAVPSVTLFDAAARYDLGQASPTLRGFTAAVNASNLADTRYVSRCSTETSCFYGNRLNIIGSVSYRW